MLLFGVLGSVPGCQRTPLVSGHAVVAIHKQNRGRLAQMLAQAESSSAKKKAREEMQIKSKGVERRE